ncbi:MAG: hypothetical protein U1E47_08870 [Rivihabitans pingtungensis]
MKKEALERVVANYGYQPTLFYEKLSNLLTNWALPLAASQAAAPSALSLAGFQFDEALPPPAAPSTASSATAAPQMTQVNQIHGQPVSKMDEPLSRAWKVVLDEALRYGVAPWLTPYPELREAIKRRALLSLPGIENEQALEVFSRQLKKSGSKPICNCSTTAASSMAWLRCSACCCTICAGFLVRINH